MEYSTYCLQRNTEYTIWLILTITDQSYHRSKLDTSRGSVLLFASLRLDEGTSMRLTYPHLDITCFFLYRYWAVFSPQILRLNVPPLAE